MTRQNPIRGFGKETQVPEEQTPKPSTPKPSSAPTTDDDPKRKTLKDRICSIPETLFYTLGALLVALLVIAIGLACVYLFTRTPKGEYERVT